MSFRFERRLRHWDWPRIVLWLFAVGGALGFAWPILHAPGSLILMRMHHHDTWMNIDDLRSLYANLPELSRSAAPLETLYHGNFYYPTRYVLATSELQLLGALVTWPLRFNPVLAHNLLLIVACMLNCFAGASFARALGANRWASITAGVAFAFSSYTGFESGRLQLLFLFPVPYALVSLLRWAHTGHARYAFITAAWMACATQLCLYYALYLALLLPIMALVLRVSVKRPGFLKDGLVLAAAFICVALPVTLILYPYMDMSAALLEQRQTESLSQRSNLSMFFTADRWTLWRDALFDGPRYDSAYFPGVAVLTFALAFLGQITTRRPLVVASIVAASAASFLAFGLMGFFACTAFIVVCASYFARQERVSVVFPLIIVLMAFSLLLFGQHEFRAWRHHLGPSPYDWLFARIPFVSSLRVARRIGVFVNLGVCACAALALTRIRRRWASPLLCIFVALVAYVEAFPVFAIATPTVSQCTDRAYAYAHAHGIDTVGEIIERDESDTERTRHRFDAGSCQVQTTLGQSGGLPPMARAANDALLALPNDHAHVWLWSSGVHWLVLRGTKRWREARVEQLRNITHRVVDERTATLIALREPQHHPYFPDAHMSGRRVAPMRAECSTRPECNHITDGDGLGRWSSQGPQNGNEWVILHFGRQRIGGIEWHCTACGANIPRALRVEFKNERGVWVMWDHFRYITPEVISRDPGHVSIALPLTPRVVNEVRLTQTDRTHDIPLSATEIELIAAP